MTSRSDVESPTRSVAPECDASTCGVSCEVSQYPLGHECASFPILLTSEADSCLRDSPPRHGELGVVVVAMDLNSEELLPGWITCCSKSEW